MMIISMMIMVVTMKMMVAMEASFFFDTSEKQIKHNYCLKN